MLTNWHLRRRDPPHPHRQNEGLPYAAPAADAFPRPHARFHPRLQRRRPACSNFDVAAPFVEWMLLGVIALRHEGKLEYDPEKMRITNNSDANKLLKPTSVKVGSSIRSRHSAVVAQALVPAASPTHRDACRARGVGPGMPGPSRWGSNQTVAVLMPW